MAGTSGCGHARRSACAEGNDNMAVLWAGGDSILEVVVSAPGAESGVTRQIREPPQRDSKGESSNEPADIADSAPRKAARGAKAEMLGDVERGEVTGH